MFWRRKTVNPYRLIMPRVTTIQEEMKALQIDSDERMEAVKGARSGIEADTQLSLIRRNVERAAKLAGEMQGLQRSADLFNAALND